MKDLKDTTTLHNGVHMPKLGLGVYLANEGGEVERAVLSALDIGYRSIDTASYYFNEVGVGKGIKEWGGDREELFIATKVWNTDQGYDSTLQAFNLSCEKLGLDYIDLYLIHWPVQGKFKETWKALEKIYQEGRARAIGVCNFQIYHLQELMAECKIVPMVNQVESHPLLIQKELLQFCQANRIQMEAWSPLMQGRLDHPTLKALAEKYDKSPAQIVLRWDLQREVVAIPKSVNPQRIKENANIFDFVLSLEDMEQINQLNENKRFGPDPDNFDF